MDGRAGAKRPADDGYGILIHYPLRRRRWMPSLPAALFASMQRYLIIHDEDMGTEVPILFDRRIPFDAMGRGFKVVAGGKVDLKGLKRYCGDRRDLMVVCAADVDWMGGKCRSDVDATIIVGWLHQRD